MPNHRSFPPVRACLFDMDGLLLNTEDLYSDATNAILAEYGREPLPWSIKAKLQGRPGPSANKIFHDWASLPITAEQYAAKNAVNQRDLFPSAAALPGVVTLLGDLGRTRYWEVKPGAAAEKGGSVDKRVHVALATSSHEGNFRLKTDHLTELFSVFPSHRRVLGDDKRLGPGRGKPLPDIFLLALKTINDSLPEGESLIKPEECLVFEDSVPGVEAGRRAGMRVIWCPHPKLKEEFAGREDHVLAGALGEAGSGADVPPAGQIGDGWAEYLQTLEDFPYGHYGIEVPPKEVESEPGMKEKIETTEAVEA
jgi:pseudouridine-5'-monophosphatase